MGVQTYTATLGVSVTVLRKVGINLPQDPPIPLLDIYPKDAQAYHMDTLLNYVHSSFICSSQNPETIKMSLNRGMDKEHLVFLHNGVLLLSC